MVTPIDKRSNNKFYEFYNDKGHITDECMQLKKQIEELVKVGKLSHFIKEIREDRDKLKNRKKEAPAKEKAATIYMIQPWHRVTRQKVTLSFAQKNEITSPPLSTNKGTEGPLAIEAEIGGHAVHRMDPTIGIRATCGFVVDSCEMRVALQLGPERARVFTDLSAEEKERYKADIRATNILLQGIPKDTTHSFNPLFTEPKDHVGQCEKDDSG
ncbi:hypothetical protein Tco_1031896 [Tanacetum coccineum]|uniref:Reverse transcriptase domain-containing protein n=1 Tax=Tanacetum coccineum TaxID=301880 RepID=A0ABQ5GAU2_9ASTR